MTTRSSATVVVILGVVACSAPPHVDDRGGKRVPGTEGVGGTLLEDTGPFGVENADGRIRVRNRSDTAHVLLEYAGSLLEPDTYVSDVRLSPGGRRLAIAVSRGPGSFTGATELFVLSVAEGDPARRPMGGPVFDVRWSRNGDAVFAVADTRQGGGQRAIYRWQFPRVR